MITNILWICNKVPSSIAKKLSLITSPIGGWLDSMPIDLLNSGFHFGIACPYYTNCDKSEGELSFYSLPEKGHRFEIEEKIKKIFTNEKPDIIHIWGTEYKHTYYFIEVAEKMGLLDKCVVSIQGLVSVIGKYHFDNGLSGSVKLGFSIHDLIKKQNILFQKRDYINRGKYEIESLQKVKNVIGRTEWDKAITEIINPNAKYYICNESLRNGFYTKEWNIDSIERHSLFVSQCNYPLKGFHYLIQAMPYIVKTYPDTVLYTTGYDLLNLNFHNIIRISYYQLYLRKLIKKNGLQNNIVFLGILDEEQMVKQYLKTHVFISPSTIENSSNSIGEAMLIGSPVVASNVGGTKSMLRDGVEGFLYPHDEPYMIAAYVKMFFESDEMCLKMSTEARKHAKKTHDRTTNINRLIEIYNNIDKS